MQQADPIPVQAFQVRPRFTLDSLLSPEEFRNRLSDGLAREDARCVGKVKRDFASFAPLPEIIHYWSPHLSISYEANTDGSTNIRGLYGPSPHVWTMFVFFYAIIGFATVIITVIGLANMSIDNSGMILWLLPVLILAFMSLYIVSYTGQRKGHDQVEDLHRFIERCADLP